MAKIDRPISEEEMTLWQRVTRTAHDLENQTTIDAIAIADAALAKIEIHTPQLVRAAARLMLVAIARQVLGSLHKPNGKPSRSLHRTDQPTFPGEEFNLLRPRYPKAHVGGKPQGYTTLESMDERDWNWNLDFFLERGNVNTAHFQQLRLWGETFRDFVRAEKRDTALRALA